MALPPEQWTAVKNLLVAGLLGGLVGMERQYTADESRESRHGPVGLRTFFIFGLLGAVAGLLGDLYHPAILATALAGTGIMIAAWYVQSWRTIPEPGLTTELAAMLTFAVGALVVKDYVVPAAAVTVTAILVLRLRRALRGITHRLTEADIGAALQMAAITAIVLPIIPDKAYDPFGVLNPFQIWFMVVLVAGIGFVGYVARRAFGDRAGFGLAGVLGGLVSSTAVTLNLSKRSKDEPGVAVSCALGVLAACAIMPVRLGVIVAAVNPSLLRGLAYPLGAMFIVGAACALIHYTWSGRRLAAETSTPAPAIPPEAPPPPEGPLPAGAPSEPRAPARADYIKNPVDLWTAIRFGLLYGGIAFAAEGARYFLAEAGIYLVSLASGATELDPITLRLARLSGPDIEAAQRLLEATAARGVVLALVSNSIFKAILAAWIGSRALARPVVAALVLSAVAGGAVAFYRS